VTASPPKRKRNHGSAPKGSLSEHTGKDRGQLALPSQRGRPSVQDRTGDPHVGRKVVALRELGLSWAQIARGLGVGRSTARNLCQKSRAAPGMSLNPKNGLPVGGASETPSGGSGRAAAFSSGIAKTGRAAPPAPGMVDLRPLKEAVCGLPTGHPARVVVLAEPDTMPRAEYAAKTVVWMRLLQIPKG